MTEQDEDEPRVDPAAPTPRDDKPDPVPDDEPVPAEDAIRAPSGTGAAFSATVRTTSSTDAPRDG